MPSGSVLSRKCGDRRSPGPPSASATSCGPSAEPPMPTTSTWRKRSARGGFTRPSCTRAAKSRTRARVSRMAAAISGVGRHLRGPQPVVADHALLVGVGDRPGLERLHRVERGLQRGLALGEGRVAEPRAAQVEPATRGRGRRTAGPCSAPRARVGSWRLLVVRDGILPPRRRGPGLRSGRRGRTLGGGGRARMTPPSRARPARRARPLLRGRGLLADLARARGGSAGRPAARPSGSARSCATRCRPTTTGTRSCRAPTRPRSPRPRPTSTPCATGRSTRASATSPRRPRATPSTRTASSSASASPTSGRATPSCASRRPSPAARPPTRGWTAGTRS